MQLTPLNSRLRILTWTQKASCLYVKYFNLNKSGMCVGLILIGGPTYSWWTPRNCRQFNFSDMGTISDRALRHI